MRTLMIALIPLSVGCANLDKHIISYDPPNGWCEERPTAFLAQYQDGSPFLRVEPVQGSSAIEWTYYDKSGAPILVERSLNEKAMFFATYYPNGQKRVAGGYRIEGDRYVPQSRWELFTEDGQPDSNKLPDDFFIYKPTEIDHQTPENYPEPTMYEGIPGNSCLLVCIDDQGKFVGAYPLEQTSEEFAPYAARAYLSYDYQPRRIAGVPVPDCQALKFHFRR